MHTNKPSCAHASNELFINVLHNNLGAVKDLLDAGVDPNAVRYDDPDAGRKNCTALYFAVKNNNKPMIELLKNHGAIYRYQVGTPAREGALMGHQKSLPIDITNMVLLYLSTGELTLLARALLEQSRSASGTKLSVSGHSDASASYSRITFFARDLFKPHFGKKPLIHAYRHMQVAAQNREFASKSLIAAASVGSYRRTKQYLESGADPHTVDGQNRSALFNAASNGHLGVVIQLLAAGSDVNAVSIFGDSVLIQSLKNGHLDVVNRLMLEPDIDVNACDRFGRTALMIAASNGHIDVVHQLLRQPGIDVNARDQDGRSVQMHAESNGHPEIVALFNQGHCCTIM